MGEKKICFSIECNARSIEQWVADGRTVSVVEGQAFYRRSCPPLSLGLALTQRNTNIPVE